MPNIGKIPATRLKLEIRKDRNGRKVLHFPFMTISDIHWGTKYSRAKRLAQMLQSTSSDRLALIGDIIDGEAMMKKKSWNFGPWHRQGIAEILRKADHGTMVELITGNHDVKMRGKNINRKSADALLHQRLSGKTVFGVAIKDQSTYQDPQGRNLLLIHGDQYDDFIFKSERQKTMLYTIGDSAYTALAEIDHAVQKLPLMEDFSLAARGKAATKTIINRFLGVHKAMARVIDDSAHDGVVYGHSHMGGFDRTSKGKMMLNDGCCTEHVQAAVHDANGNWALIEWHADRLDIQMENGSKDTVYWADLGLGHFGDDPAAPEDEYTIKTDRLLRIMYRAWPARDRQKLKESLYGQKRLVSAFAAMEKLSARQKSFYNAAVTACAEQSEKIRKIPIMRRVLQLPPAPFLRAA